VTVGGDRIFGASLLFETLPTGRGSLAALAVFIADDLLDHAGEKSKDTSTDLSDVSDAS
jgi:hypothetical protein